MKKVVVWKNYEESVLVYVCECTYECATTVSVVLQWVRKHTGVIVLDYISNSELGVEFFIEDLLDHSRN